MQFTVCYEICINIQLSVSFRQLFSPKYNPVYRRVCAKPLSRTTLTMYGKCESGIDIIRHPDRAFESPPPFSKLEPVTLYLRLVGSVRFRVVAQNVASARDNPRYVDCAHLRHGYAMRIRFCNGVRRAVDGYARVYICSGASCIATF